jgi:hypothetical protein
MNIDESQIRLEIVDDQLHYVSTSVAWSQLFAGELFRGKLAFSESLKELIAYQVNFTTRFPEFVCSLVDEKVFPY